MIFLVLQCFLTVLSPEGIRGGFEDELDGDYIPLKGLVGLNEFQRQERERADAIDEFLFVSRWVHNRAVKPKPLPSSIEQYAKSIQMLRDFLPEHYVQSLLLTTQDQMESRLFIKRFWVSWAEGFKDKSSFQQVSVALMSRPSLLIPEIHKFSDEELKTMISKSPRDFVKLSAYLINHLDKVGRASTLRDSSYAKWVRFHDKASAMSYATQSCRGALSKDFR